MTQRFHLSKPLIVLLSTVIVGVVTWLLMHIQLALIAQQGRYIRPFGIGYLIPIALMTRLGGLPIGLFTLILAMAACIGLMIPQNHLMSPRDLTELGFILVVGGMTVFGADAMRRNAQLLAEAEQAVRREKENANRQLSFLRDMLLSVTNGRLLLCEFKEQLPYDPHYQGEPHFLSAQDISSLRKAAYRAAIELEFPAERSNDLMVAVDEAAMNAVRHAGNGIGKVCVLPDDTVQVWIEDRGPGIALDRLPGPTLEAGRLTTGNLGHGFRLMLRTVDRIYLFTDPTGTTIVLEQSRYYSEPDLGAGSESAYGPHSEGL